MSSKTCPHCGGSAYETSQTHTAKHAAAHGFCHGHIVVGVIGLFLVGLQKLGIIPAYQCEKCKKEF